MHRVVAALRLSDHRERRAVELSSAVTLELFVFPLIMSRGAETLALSLFCIPLCQVQLHKPSVYTVFIMNTHIGTNLTASRPILEFLEYHGASGGAVA